MKNNIWKRITLAGLMIALLLGLTGCLTKQDKTVDDQPTDPVQVLPFETSTPTPSPGPTGAGAGEGQTGWEDWNNQTPAVVVTREPTPTPTIQLYAPSATPTQIAVAVPTARPSAAPTDDGTLRNGSSGTAVRLLQQRLKDLGYYTGTVDGTFGAATEAAVRDFQAVNGLASDGVVGSKTLDTLNASTAISKAQSQAASYVAGQPTPSTYAASTPSVYRILQPGSSSNDVRQLQQRLSELSYFNGSITGSYGQDTKAAVEAFQFRNGLRVDGVAGEETQRLLYSSAALAYANLAPKTAVLAPRSLKSGMTGDDVSQLQTRLTALYYFNDTINGQYGTTTELAVRVFQQRNGLTVDGVAGTETLAALYASSALYAPTAQPTATAFRAGATLQSGSTGEAVYSLQERLYDLGYYTGRIDGVYTDAVVTAVRAFQTANGLTADGKAGSSTQTLLYSTKAKAASSADDSYATLRKGDTGERVRALQALLSTYGYYTDTVNGNYDAATETAVMQLQATNGLAADGIAGPATQQVLYLGTPKAAAVPQTAAQSTVAFQALRQGMSGSDVMVLQQYLQDMGYYVGMLDGTFGSTTLIAVQAFQQRNSLKADGVAGSETLALLFSGTGIAADGGAASGFSIDADDEPIYIAPSGVTAPERASVKQGDEGQDVMDLQARLAELGYFSGTPDGVFGSSTIVAVRNFQQSNGLTVDGVAGAATRAALYAIGVVASGQTGSGDLHVVTNRSRELEEQQASGAIQGSLSGGGVAASLSGSVYYAGDKGALYVTSTSGNVKKLYDGAASFIHATDKGITFVSGGKIMRVGANGGTAQTIVEAGGIEKLSLLGETMYYLEGSSLVKLTSGGEPAILAGDVKDFSLDVYQYVAYTASADGVRSVPLVGEGGGKLLVSADADQVQLCDSVVFFRSGGAIYRIENGVSILLIDADATWMGVYRDMVYYVSGDRLYRADTSGQGNQIFYDGQTAGVSFVAGRAYITKSHGGAVTEILPVE